MKEKSWQQKEAFALPTNFIDALVTFAEKKTTKAVISNYKLKLCSSYKLKYIPTDIEILLQSNPAQYAKLQSILTTKPVRTIAGVAPIALMTSPAKCPHGTCTFCPGGLGSPFGDVPQSYTGKEPSTRRAARNNYDPYLIVMNRLEQYFVLGHFPQKVEIIIQGGTFPAREKEYQEEFVMYTFKAMNDFSDLFFSNGVFNLAQFKKFFLLPGNIFDEARRESIHTKLLLLKKKKTTLTKEQKKNETSCIRCVGLTIETKPDCAKILHCEEMLRLGCTRVELGVQTLQDAVLRKTNRGHTLKDTIDATRFLKDFGFKVNYHMMPGLPGVLQKTDQKDLEMLFTEEAYQPDMLKIYPTMVMEGTVLADAYKRGQYTPLRTPQAVKLIAKAMKDVPTYVRIMRVQRDIPTQQTLDGVNRTNLRQYIDAYMKKKKWMCNDIREREIKSNKPIDIKKITYHSLHYPASQGIEFFLSAEYKNQLLGYCRLRFPHESLRTEITKDSALLRELHVVGQLTAIGSKGKQIQHIGIGKKLMQQAEKISRTHHKNKMVVISGIGVRDYYQQLGYMLEVCYMVKRL